MEIIRNHLNKPLLIALVLAAIFIISACGAAQPAVRTQEAEVSPPPAVEQSNAQEIPEDGLAENAPTPGMTDEPAPTVAATDLENDPVAEGYPAPGYQFPTDTPASQSEPYPSPQEEVPPPVKTELEATDPSTVNLVSGEPQLLEFFAFW